MHGSQSAVLTLDPIQLGLSRRLRARLPWRWEIVRPLDRYGEQMSPEFATEAQAREHGRRQGLCT